MITDEKIRAALIEAANGVETERNKSLLRTYTEEQLSALLRDEVALNEEIDGILLFLRGEADKVLSDATPIDIHDEEVLEGTSIFVRWEDFDGVIINIRWYPVLTQWRLKVTARFSGEPI